MIPVNSHYSSSAQCDTVMSTLKLLSILLIQFDIIVESKSNLIEEDSNLQKSKLERNNIVNKRVWMKNKFKDNLYEKATLGDFIFRANSLDVDNMLQNNFDVFDEDRMQDTPVVSSYIKRERRSPNTLRKHRSSKSLINCKDVACMKLKRLRKNQPEFAKSMMTESPKDLKPPSVFNDPYEFAILLNNNKKDYVDYKSDNINKTDEPVETIVTNPVTVPEISFSIEGFNKTNSNNTQPKRSMKYDYESEVIKKFEFVENVSKSDYKVDKKYDRNVFDKDDQTWHTIPVTDEYNVIPKEPVKSKPVTERGLIKVISMLTKTYKKIMRQHNEIKNIHVKIREMSNDLAKNVASMNQKFQEFDSKYAYLTKFNQDLNNFEQKLVAKEEYFRTKEKEMANSLNEFENQQKKFLTQQRQFYNIQKLMLAQNEKINIKQNLIAKTQSEISHRQNNFARILKKAKQLYIDSKNLNTTKINLTTPPNNEEFKQEVVTTTSTETPPTENIKINLFSIPTSNKIENQDDLIIKEKDEQAIDDLVYKYYFNNTFIDNLMKNKVLAGIFTSDNTNAHARNIKTKRDYATTLLLPIKDTNKSIVLKELDRNRRWINHHSRHKNKRKNRGKGDQVTIINATDEKLLETKMNRNNTPLDHLVAPRKEMKKNPFITMATNFCNELHRSMNQQMMDWCIEKALRRLQHIDFTQFSQATEQSSTIASKMMKKTDDMVMMMSPKVLPLLMKQPISEVIETDNEMKNVLSSVKPKASIDSSTVTNGMTLTGQHSKDMTSPTIVTKETAYTLPTYAIQEATAVFFPDNDELESNLKQYEIKPDTAGNIYYEGSLHGSDIADDESEFTDDFMPGLDSNSRVEVDPMAFDVQAKRRAYIRRLKERIKKSF